MKLSEIASRLECRLDGDGDVEIRRIAALEEAGPGDLTFFVNPKYAAHVRGTRASAVILADRADASPPPGVALLRTANPYLAFARAAEMFAPPPAIPPGVHRLASIDPSAIVAPDAAIGAFVTVGARARIGARTMLFPHVTIGDAAVIGDDCLLHARVSIRERVVLGDRVVVQDGAVIGSDGFGFARTEQGAHHKIPQTGGVVVEDDVEIGANTTIDRPAVGETRIGAGTKIDNLVQVAHGVKLGKQVLLAAQVGIAGSTRIDDRVTLAGQVGVAGHLTIGAGVTATAQTGIPNSVEPGKLISGYPAIDNRDWLKSSAVFRRLPELKKAVADLQRRLDALEERLGE
ncbi:MAG TPA: UDP-3-O-(3-hydroxymyristoyl)glucosamine N-acyltransferase [Vicinamibacterales bacterium]|nr:UDP-3-O-(3-hydroxymyristoyl)glucosamine N-acyltransferase [Vicinamibacterales bacterium]